MQDAEHKSPARRKGLVRKTAIGLERTAKLMATAA